MAKREFKWPKGFMWGAATAAHQIEGNNVNNWSVWELQTAKHRADTAKRRWGRLPAWSYIGDLAINPDNYVSGRAVDHYRRYKEDFALMKELGFNTYRFSIEWSRIEPDEGAWNIEALEHYRAYIAELRALGIEPMMTLFHWTVPLWFAEKGGFEKAKNIVYFERFAQRIIKEFGMQVRSIVTINEPDTVSSLGYIMLEHPPGTPSLPKAGAVYLNLLRAHKRVYKFAKAYDKDLFVGFSKSYACVKPADDTWLSKAMVWLDYTFRDDVILRFVGKKTDFIGVQFYHTDQHKGWDFVHGDIDVTDVGWDREPQNLEFVLKRLGRWKRPLIVTETGIADKRDVWRQDWIERTVLSVQRAIKAGVDVRGYLYWSLMDNFEWAYGRWPAFGLIDIDYEHNLQRTVRPSARYYAAVIKKADKSSKTT